MDVQLRAPLTATAIALTLFLATACSAGGGLTSNAGQPSATQAAGTQSGTASPTPTPATTKVQALPSEPAAPSSSIEEKAPEPQVTCPPDVTLPADIDPALVCGGMPADAIDIGDHFMSPSQNLGCDDWPQPGKTDDPLINGLFGCTVIETDVEPPQCEVKYGPEPTMAKCPGIGIMPEGESLPFNIHQSPRWYAGSPAGQEQGITPTPVLEYGQTARFKNVACRSDENGMTCWNTDTGHGLHLNRSTFDRW